MPYSINAITTSQKNAFITIKATNIPFGVNSKNNEDLASPAELFLSSFSACILKNLERFSTLLKFEYSHAAISVNAIRNEKPPKLDEINYSLKIYSKDVSINLKLLKKNIEKYGTIYNTVNSSCSITGEINIIREC